MATMTLREYARSGKPCLVNLPGCQTFHEGVCLAHWRDGSTGAGQKEHDLIGAWACPHCHDLVDGRKRLREGHDPQSNGHIFIQTKFMRGIIKTQQEVLRALKEGKVRLPK